MRACCVGPSADKTLKTDAASGVVSSGVVAQRDKMSGAEDGEYDRLVWEQFHNQSRIGKDRRRFLIVAVFDFCLVTLLWILYTVSKGGDWATVFRQETDFKNPLFFKTSLFDVTLAACARMIYLIVFYALLRVRHWVPVAASTVFTTLALVVKVLFYFTEKDSNVPQYLVVLSSFIVAWVELWMLPFQVLSRERRNTHAVVPEAASASTSRTRHGPRLPGNLTDEEFRSAMEYSSGSSDEDNVVGRPRLPSVCRPYSNAEAGRQAMMIAKGWYESTQSWQQICSDPVVKCTNDRDRGKVYYVKAELPAPPSRIFRIVHSDSDRSPVWNKSVKENRVVLRVDDSTDVCYSVSAPALRGYIASRDFLDARYVEVDAEKQIYTMAVISVNSTILPPNINKRIIRGENGPNIWILKPLAQDANHTSFEWIMNTDVKGEIPKRLVERSMSAFLINYVKALSAHVAELSRTGNV